MEKMSHPVPSSCSHITLENCVNDDIPLFFYFFINFCMQSSV